MGYLLAFLRFIVLILSLFIVVSIGTFMYYTKIGGPKMGYKIRTLWCKFALSVFGIRLIKTGDIDLTDGILYISNHRSFIDPVIAFACISNGAAVSKAEVANYPLIGLGAKISGVIFVDRSNKSSRSSTKDAILNALINKTSVLLFPEGTINTKANTLEFRKGSFEAAAQANAPIVPFAIEYMNPKKDFWYIENLLLQYFVSFSSWRMDVRVHFFPKFESDNAELLMNHSYQKINGKLSEFQAYWKKEDLLDNLK